MWPSLSSLKDPLAVIARRFSHPPHLSLPPRHAHHPPLFRQHMSAFTSTAIAHTTHSRHYGKLPSIGYSQDMEIDPDLPRPAAPDSLSAPMNTSLDSHHHDRKKSPIEEPNNELPSKPAAQEQSSQGATRAQGASNEPDSLGHKGRISA